MERTARDMVGSALLQSHEVTHDISYLRRKLGELTPQVGILSVRGRGYALVGGEIVSK